MICKIVLLGLFAVSQSAHREPWWIQMFFPNVSFTGKYHPSNYKVEKSPLYPDWAQNPNDVWSPAYWMPYKQAYAQYWLDYINNATEAEKQQAKNNQTDQYGGHGQNGYHGQVGYQHNGYHGQFGFQGQQNGYGGQYGFQGQQNGYNGQYGFQGQNGYGNQYGFQGQQNGYGGQYGFQGQQNGYGGQYGFQGQQNGPNGQYEFQGQQNQNSTNEQNTQISQEASTIVQQVENQVENMNNDYQQIAAGVTKESENQIQNIVDEANKKKDEIEADGSLNKEEIIKLESEINKAAEAKIVRIVEETAGLEKELAVRFGSLNAEAEKVAVEASKLAGKTDPQPRFFQY